MIFFNWSSIECREAMTNLKKPIENWISMKENTTLLTLKDSAKFIKENRNEAKKVAVWSKRGKVLYTAEEYCSLAKSISVDITECPFDDFNATGESKKRNRKSYDRTKHCLDVCLAQDSDKENKVIDET